MMGVRFHFSHLYSNSFAALRKNPADCCEYDVTCAIPALYNWCDCTKTRFPLTGKPLWLFKIS